MRTVAAVAPLGARLPTTTLPLRERRRQPLVTEPAPPPSTAAPPSETTPEKDAADRQDRGSFASGEETTPGKDSYERVHVSGTFAAGEEETPKKDAAERVHPGTFADSEPEAEPTA